MAEVFVETGARVVNYVVEKYWDPGYDSLTSALRRKRVIAQQQTGLTENTAPFASSDAAPRTRSAADSLWKAKPAQEVGIRNKNYTLNKETGEYFRQPLSGSRMSYSNGGFGQPQQQQRANSAQPPRSRYYDDDDEYGSDYDDRNGRRHGTTGHGYDDRYDDDARPYDREVIETERYKGVSGALVVRQPDPRHTHHLHPPYPFTVLSSSVPVKTKKLTPCSHL